MRKNIAVFLTVMLIGCSGYHSPDRATWSNYLTGASFIDMNEISRTAKRPVYLGTGGKIITADGNTPELQYGDKLSNDNSVVVNYMALVEHNMYDTLRKPGISVQRAGADVVIILVRDSIMELNVAEISDTGQDTLHKIAQVLKKYPATFIEIAGYTDAMHDKNAAYALSLDMAKRVGVYLSQNGINTSRMFIVGRGSSRPIAGQDDVGRLTNRRVEIKLAPAR